MGSDFLAYLQMLEFIAFLQAILLFIQYCATYPPKKNNAAIFSQKIYEFCLPLMQLLALYILACN